MCSSDRASSRANGAGKVDAYLESDGNVVSNIPDIHGIATDWVDIVGRNLAGAANDRERMLCRTNILRAVSLS